MNLQELYNLKSKFIVRSVGEELILVPLTCHIAQMNELFILNETGKFIWENIGVKTSISDIENLMTDIFDIDCETVNRDIEYFIKKLETML
jgi:hypothetical protein